uniref:Uncharacterized protein n=3 Tax=Oryza TaxID=4527 RepID=A0A0E0BKV6_9ORYZ
MASQIIETYRAGAEIINGDAAGKKRSIEMLQELGLPKGLFPLDDIEEFGYNRANCFMWILHSKKKEHTFKKIKQTVSYATEVTAFVEKGKLKKIAGVKTKELMLWLSVVEVYVDESSPGKITFKTGTGLSDSFDALAFDVVEKNQQQNISIMKRKRAPSLVYMNAMASQIIETNRVGAEVINGDAASKKKSIELLQELNLPKGLFPLDDIEEFGYNRANGFMWILHRKKKEHTFKKIKQTVSYATEVTAFVEKGKLKKITGVKTKELMLWLSVVEVYVEESSAGKITFKTGTGLSDSFDASAFELDM